MGISNLWILWTFKRQHPTNHPPTLEKKRAFICQAIGAILFFTPDFLGQSCDSSDFESGDSSKSWDSWRFPCKSWPLSNQQIPARVNLKDSDFLPISVRWTSKEICLHIQTHHRHNYILHKSIYSSFLAPTWFPFGNRPTWPTFKAVNRQQ